MKITIGSRVRSFDFADTLDDGTQFGRDLSGERACYVEGIVTDINTEQSYRRYEISVLRDVFGGKESDRRVGNVVYPPVNGTPAMFGDACDYVELVQEERE